MSSINFNVLWLDGQPNGRIKCSSVSFNGVAIKIPKNLLEQSKGMEYMNNAGIYFLFGANDDGKKWVYVGQSNSRKNNSGVLNRIIEHARDRENKDFNDAIILTPPSNYWGGNRIKLIGK
ncbi:hypothetical protein [Mycoplasma simbae]|uniref:hypothetical protein n=1 Tax=Mycoplasma simbae TaxID=36744 RepID=UPI000690A360|nr:hypothetical protein [Mycoplasma simbae]